MPCNRNRTDFLGNLFLLRLLGVSRQWSFAHSVAMDRIGNSLLPASYPLSLACAHSLRADVLERSVRDTLGVGHG